MLRYRSACCVGWLWATFVCGLTACASDPGGGTEPSASLSQNSDDDAVAASVCTEQDSRPCSCSSREVGVQRCKADGSGFATGCTDCRPDLPAMVRLQVFSVAAMPGRTEKETWDGGETPPVTAWEVAAAAAGAPGTGAAVKAIADYTIGVLDRPDIGGTFEVLRGGMWDPLEAVPDQDEFLPTWSDLVWEGVVLDRDAQLGATLYDNDVLSNDELPRLSIAADALIAAWVDGGAYWIEGQELLDQTKGAILGVQLQLLSE